MNDLLKAYNEKFPPKERIALLRAIEKGDVVRPTVCEVCGLDVTKKTHDRWGFPLKKQDVIVAHHYLGYDHPTDVWWVCRSCNAKLAHMHDGRFQTVQDYRDYLAEQERLQRAQIEAFNASLPADCGGPFEQQPARVGEGA